MTRLRRALSHHGLHVGWTQIVARLAQDATAARAASVPWWLLVGCYHDAPAQVEAFRRLVGPLGVPVKSVALEQFDADGAWQGISPTAQRGDDAALAAYLGRGDRAAFARLLARQQRSNYTGWKYDYLPRVLDLLLQARASATPLWPCDMPLALQRRLRRVATDEQLLRLRELHCYRALSARPPVRGAARWAMLWGQDHVGAEGFARFLPPSARVITLYLFGGRKSEVALGRGLATRLALAAPLLVTDADSLNPPSHRRWILLLPDAALGAHVERRRDEPTGTGRRRLLVHAPAGSVLHLGAKRVPVGRKPLALALAPDDQVFALEHARRLLIGSLDLAREGTLELELAPRRRTITLTVKAAR